MSLTPVSHLPAGLAIGLDLGGTKCLGVAVEITPAGGVEVRAECRRATPEGAGPIVEVMGEVAAVLVEDLGRPAVRLGAGVPGLITPRGVMRASPNLPGVFELDIATELERVVRARCPWIDLEGLTVDNDANCAARAEWADGAGRGIDDLVMVTLGTGIGGGIILGGRAYRGSHGFAGEFGHMVVDPHGDPCPCGQRGCWERYASGTGLARLAAAAGMSLDGESALRSEDVVAAARQGVPVASEVMDLFAEWLAIGLVNIANLFDPEMIVCGGGLVAAADLFLPATRSRCAELLYASAHREHPLIEVARSDHRAGAIGAAVAAIMI